MDHEKLWNKLKEEMLVRSVKERNGKDTSEYLLFASEIVKKMAQAEVEEYNRNATKKEELDTKMMEELFPPKFIIKREGE